MNQEIMARIIIIDDEGSLIEGMTRILTGKGYEVTGHTSAAKAIECLKKKEYHILLTDLMMPSMNGIEVLAAARAVDPTLACIIMTGHATVDTAIKAMKGGEFDYILKPFEPEVILQCLHGRLK